MIDRDEVRRFLPRDRELGTRNAAAILAGTCHVGYMRKSALRTRQTEKASMGEFQTLAQRKAQAVREMAEAHTQLQVELERYAHVHGGRFFLYGSVARGDYRFDSDIDILVDFPEPIESEAWQFAEEACLKRALKPDVRPLRYCGPNLLEHIRPHMKTIQ